MHQIADAPACRAATAVLIAANPYSGYGANRMHAEQLVDALSAFGLHGRILWTIRDYQQALSDPLNADRCRCVVAAGGDGTIADILNLNQFNIPIATMPLGNENLFARQFGYTCKPEHIARTIAHGRLKHIDLGMANGRLFSLMVSAGFDAEVVHRVDQWRKATNDNTIRRICHLNYLTPTIKSLQRYRYPRIALQADGQQHTGAQVFIFNMPQYGANMPFAPMADPTDGLLDFVVFKRHGLAQLLLYALAVKCRQHLNWPDVDFGKAKSLSITADDKCHLQADGDPAGTLPATVTVKPMHARIWQPTDH